MQRLTVALATGVLLAAMVPSLAVADQGGVPNERSVVIHTPAMDGGPPCFISGFTSTEVGIDVRTWNFTETVKDGMDIAMCRFGPDDITAGSPPPSGYRGPLPVFPESTIHVNANGHGWMRLVFVLP